MALFWHNHFATAYTKIAGAYDGTEATRMLAAKPAEDRDGTKGQLELFREHALGNFRDLLIAVSKDPAMLVWLDGRDNIATRPQENYAREIMELFTFGVANVVEDDVKAAARVFTGWNLQPRSARAAPTTTATSSAPTGTTTRSRTSPSRSTRTAAAPSPPTASRKAST